MMDKTAHQSKAINKNEQGFSLIETAIALVIMMVVTLATGALYVFSTNYNAGSADRQAALAIAQQRLERLRRSSWDDTDLTTPSTNETVTNAGRRYTLQTDVCSTSVCGGSDTLKIITVQVTPMGASQWSNAPVIVVTQRATIAVGPYESN